VAHSSRGLGHLPLKEEITGSNPVCATNTKKTAIFKAKPAEMAVSFYRFANNAFQQPLFHAFAAPSYQSLLPEPLEARVTSGYRYQALL
jgi:hypothetical protein